MLLGEGVPCDLLEHLFPPTESCLYTVSGSSQSQGMRECDCTASGPQLPEEAQKEPCPSTDSVPTLIQPGLISNPT